MRPYHEFAALKPYVFEESYVLGISATPGQVIFDLDLVLTPVHPEYHAPKPGEQYCFRRAALVFTGVSHLSWSSSGHPPAMDASGEIDYGQIDAFEWDGRSGRLEGDWGEMEIVSSSAEVALVTQ